VNILYYDDSLPKENLFKIIQHVQDQTGYDLVVVPKNYELILDCPAERLLEVRAKIDKALAAQAVVAGKKESC
jgi:hypothetical protein